MNAYTAERVRSKYLLPYIEHLESEIDKLDINGAQLVITRNDSLLYARGFGMADKERGIRMEPNMLMRFASRQHLRLAYHPSIQRYVQTDSYSLSYSRSLPNQFKE